MTMGQSKGPHSWSLIPGEQPVEGRMPMRMRAYLPEHVLGFLQVKVLSCKKSQGKRRLEARSRTSRSLEAHEEIMGCPKTFPDTPRIYWGSGKFVKMQ